jgi:ribosome-binding factor A
MPGIRKERLEELLKREISEIIRREVKDPRIGFVTVTDAEVSNDLSFAKVFVSVLGTEEQQAAALKGLNSATRFIRGEFGQRIKLRQVPEITFRIDTGIQHGARIHELLEQIRREEQEQAAEGGSAAPLAESDAGADGERTEASGRGEGGAGS